jgi:hypothetical protein
MGVGVIDRDCEGAVVTAMRTFKRYILYPRAAEAYAAWQL